MKKKILWLTNIPSPYRVNFFNLLGKSVDLTVIFERKESIERNRNWYENNYDRFNYYFLKGIKFGTDRSISFSVIKHLNKNFDYIFVANPMTPTGIIATTYLKIRGIPFVIEGDGGFPKYSESKLKTKIKKFFLKKALWYLSSGKSHTDYYKYYEVDQSKIINYHFSSVSEKDIIKKIFSNKDKMTIKKKYNIENERVILYVGRFVISKGLDILFEALREIKTNYLLILVGDNEETFEKLPLITFDVNYKVMGFKTKDELREVYDMSDFLVLPTRGDVWGLVINEAFARGLPVISTNKSGAAIELIENSSNGFIIESENFKQLKDKLRILLSENLTDISNHALNKIRMYTIEQMTKDHESLLGINK